MLNSSPESVIRLRGVRQNNLKNFDLDLPLGKLVVVTGLSGSGKSSLAFDTLYAEGQRRYIETFSPYARQFFDRMDKPQVDSIQGIPPAIALEQRNSVKSTRSTVGTMTEISDYMKVLWPMVSKLVCKGCGQDVRKDTSRQIWETMTAQHAPDTEWTITFTLALSPKLSLSESLALVVRQGYQRLLIGEGTDAPRTIRVEEAEVLLGSPPPGQLTVVQDRLNLQPRQRGRFVEALEQAYHFGKGRLAIYGQEKGAAQPFSQHQHCAGCDLAYSEPRAGMFSFNNPLGACPACKGFGRIISIDYRLAIPDPSLSLKEGVVKPWQTETGAQSQEDLTKACRKHRVPMNVPFAELSPEHRQWVIEGDPGYGTDPELEWPKAWYGVKGYFKYLESKSYKMHVRVLLSRYRVYTLCQQCHGTRFQPETLLYKATDPHGRSLTLPAFYNLTVHDALRFVAGHVESAHQRKPSDPLRVAVEEVASRLAYLEEVGLGYLTIDRPTRSLSGGETERVNLTTCLGSRLVNTLFVLDEPSVGLHPRDTARLVTILNRLRDRGNTLVVVEHEASVMRAADQIIDIGPGHGECGGELIFQGTYGEILRAAHSITGAYLSGRMRMDAGRGREVNLELQPKLILSEVTRHNLNHLTLEIPLGRLVCVTGVSGSGKTTLVREVLFPLLENRLHRIQTPSAEESEEDDQDGMEEELEPRTTVGRLEGAEHLGQGILVDQSSLGRTPRSNPAVYTGAFVSLRDLFASSDEAKAVGLNSSAFSFNSVQGQCGQCRGTGFEKIEMQFLSDIFIRCAECHGRRYRGHVLEIKLKPSAEICWSIADLLESTVDEGILFLNHYPSSKPAQRALASLLTLQEIGLGYLKLGQPINTLSGGESQRLKLARHLTECAKSPVPNQKPTLYIFDEPTTGLHYEDIRILMRAFQKMVDAGHSIIIVEHNLEVIRMADWIIDLGPEAGEHGGRVVVQGTPEQVMDCPSSITGAALRGA